MKKLSSEEAAPLRSRGRSAHQEDRSGALRQVAVDAKQAWGGPTGCGWSPSLLAPFDSTHRPPRCTRVWATPDNARSAASNRTSNSTKGQQRYMAGYIEGYSREQEG
ncbi:hypothetical protein VTO73DRAFT_13236 [Trametes versicolor]